MVSLLSVVIPCYNSEIYIEDCINSLRRQGDFNHEVIFVNDGSTDDTLEIIKKCCVNNERWSYINNKHNVGCPASRNIGINNSKGNVIFNMDSDNVLPDNLLIRMFNYFLDNKCSMLAVQKIRYFDHGDKIVERHVRKFDKNQYGVNDILKSFDNPFSSGNFMYTKNCWEKVGCHHEESNRWESWYFSFKFVINGYKCDILPESYYWHRRSNTTLSIVSKKGGLDRKTLCSLLLTHSDILETSTVKKIKNSPLKSIRKLLNDGKFKFNKTFLSKVDNK